MTYPSTAPLPRRRRPVDWSARALTLWAAATFALGWGGFVWHLSPQGLSAWMDTIYRTVLLFSLILDKTGIPDPVPAVLQLARFGAFVTSIWALLKAFFPQVRIRARLWIRRLHPGHALILGYGPVGQAIGTALIARCRDIGCVTAVHPAPSAEMILRARMDGVLLIEGDPDDPVLLARVSAGRARRVFLSGADDLRTIDAAMAVQRRVPKGDLRAILQDGAVAARMAEATGNGYLGAPGLRWYSIADETARLLVAEARFDRVAVETGAGRMHLVVVGCGNQGEAIVVEALLTAWRTGLGPPRITVIDCSAGATEARLRQRMPAWFLKPDGQALPALARPDLRFLDRDAEVLDLAADADLADLRAQVSAWVFAMGDPGLNLRASLALHRAMVARQIDPAPIHIRVPHGRAEDTPLLKAAPLSLARTFGALEEVMARAPLITPDPDALPRRLHTAYVGAAQEMGLGPQPGWDRLDETRREANRALFRHSAMKIEDFGAEAQPPLNGLPVADPALASRLARIDGMLDYGRIARGQDALDWLRPGAVPVKTDSAALLAVRDAALCEHSRWVTERALAQFVPAPSPQQADRDIARRLHNNMHDWHDLHDSNIRRFDVVMLRALFAGSDAAPTVRPARVRNLILPVLAGDRAGEAVVLTHGATLAADITELRLSLVAAEDPAAPDALLPALMAPLLTHLAPGTPGAPRRLRVDFHHPPGPGLLRLANLLTEAAAMRCGPRLSIEGLWAWRAQPGPTLGFVGHRDLAGFGPGTGLADRLRRAFAAEVAATGAETLICGYAPGADRAAVAAWASLGLPPPRLVFPFRSVARDGAVLWHSDDPAVAGADDTLTDTAAQALGLPVLPDDGPGHKSQANHVLARCQTLIALADNTRPPGAFGTLETLAKAKSLGRKTVVLGPEAPP